jgi:hypothetical protein
LKVVTGGIQWSLQVGDFVNACTWSVAAKGYEPDRLPKGFGEFATKAPYQQRVVQSLKRVYELLTVSDLSKVYTFGEVGDAKLLRDAIRGGDILGLSWPYIWDPHAEIKLLCWATKTRRVWCSKYIGVSKLMCLLCDTWYRSYNAFYNEGFHYLGCHDHVFKYYKLPVLLQFQPVVLQFQGCLTKLQWKRKLETDGDQQFFVYKLKTRGRTKQVRDRSPEPKRDPL